jgi:hypothetical protein
MASWLPPEVQDFGGDLDLNEMIAVAQLHESQSRNTTEIGRLKLSVGALEKQLVALPAVLKALEFSQNTCQMQLVRLLELQVDTAEKVERLVAQQKMGFDSVCRAEVALKNLTEHHNLELRRVQGGFDVFSSARGRVSRELSVLRSEMNRGGSGKVWTESEHVALKAQVQDLRNRLNLNFQASSSSHLSRPFHLHTNRSVDSRNI